MKQAERFQTLAKNPELVEQAKAEARRSRQIKGVAKRDAVQNPADSITKRDRDTVADHDGKGVSVSDIPRKRKTAEMTV